jgi:hypothetical protein
MRIVILSLAVIGPSSLCGLCNFGSIPCDSRTSKSTSLYGIGRNQGRPAQLH